MFSVDGGTVKVCWMRHFHWPNQRWSFVVSSLRAF